MAKKIAKKVDLTLLTVVSLLVVWGILTVSTISFPFSLKNFQTPWHHLFHQLLMLGIGFGLALLCFFIPLEKLAKLAPWLFLLNLLLLGLVFFPKIGLSGGGAKRWLQLGSFSFQPSEFIKLTFILYLAAWLARKQINRERGVKIFLPFCAVLAVLLAVLIAQPDMSTLFIIIGTGLAVYFCSGTPLWQTGTLLAAVLSLGYLLVKKAPYRLARLLIFLNPEKDPLGMGYQLRQSMIALGSGRLMGINNGLALGLSRQKFGFLPEPMTDSIFAIIGEELGFLGALALIGLFIFFAFWAVKLALKTDNLFAKFLTLGIVCWLTMQAFFNISGIIGLMPLAGLPLPFFSYGGSHLIVEMAAVGLLLNISKKYA